MSTMKISVSSTAGKGMRTESTAGCHEFATDEPPALGGKDTAPSPLEAYLGALAGCENAIANFAAREMGFDLQGIQFEINAELDTRGIMGDSSVKPYFSRVDLTARVSTEESDERILELGEKVDSRCPIFTLIKAAGVDISADWHRAE